MRILIGELPLYQKRTGGGIMVGKPTSQIFEVS
jgi:hypothetical protein